LIEILDQGKEKVARLIALDPIIIYIISTIGIKAESSMII
jgi:hypothetical protein